MLAVLVYKCPTMCVISCSRFDPTSSSPLSQTEVQAMLQSTRKQIVERRQQTQLLVMVSDTHTSTVEPLSSVNTVRCIMELSKMDFKLYNIIVGLYRLS